MRLQQDKLKQVGMKVELQCMELLMPVLGLGLGLALEVEEQNVYLMRRYFYPSCSSVNRHKTIRYKLVLRRKQRNNYQSLTIAETSTCIMSFTSPADLQIY